MIHKLPLTDKQLQTLYYMIIEQIDPSEITQLFTITGWQVISHRQNVLVTNPNSRYQFLI